jgi:hypothetical protein
VSASGPLSRLRERARERADLASSEACSPSLAIFECLFNDPEARIESIALALDRLDGLDGLDGEKRDRVGWHCRSQGFPSP